MANELHAAGKPLHSLATLNEREWRPKLRHSTERQKIALAESLSRHEGTFAIIDNSLFSITVIQIRFSN